MFCAVMIMAVCRSGRNVDLDSEKRRRGNEVSARSMCLVCCAAWLKILQTGQNRDPPLLWCRSWCAFYSPVNNGMYEITPT